MSLEAAHYLIDDYKENVTEQISFIVNPTNDWTSIMNPKIKEEKFNIHTQLLNSILLKVKYITKEAGDDIYYDRKVKQFIKDTTGVFKTFEDLVKTYFRDNRIQVLVEEGRMDIDNEIVLQDKIMRKVIEYSEALRSIALSEQKKDVKIKTYGDQIFSLPHVKSLTDKHIDIQKMWQEKLNFTN